MTLDRSVVSSETNEVGVGVERQVADAAEALLAVQKADGHWVFELEADSTIPSEYIFLEHYLDEIDQELEEKIANYLRAAQADHGGDWGTTQTFGQERGEASTHGQILWIRAS